MSSADNICKEFGPRSGPSGLIWIQTVWHSNGILDFFIEKVEIEEKHADDNKACKIKFKVRCIYFRCIRDATDRAQRACYYSSGVVKMKSGLQQTGLEVIKLFSCSTQLGMKFQLLIKVKILKNKIFLALKLTDTVRKRLTHKAPSIICSRRQFQILPFFKYNN